MSVFTRTARSNLLEAARMAEEVNGVAPNRGTELHEAVLTQLKEAFWLTEQAGSDLRLEITRLRAL